MVFGPIIQHRVWGLPFTVEQIEEIFKRHDKNKDGQLSKDELREAFKELGSRYPPYRGYNACKYADNDHDGLVNLNNNEFRALLDYTISCGYKLT